MKANFIGSGVTIKWDEYGFTLVNFASFIPIFNQSLTFPLHVEQVFFLVIRRKEDGKWFYERNLVGDE
jgi:hypothetical protein